MIGKGKAIAHGGNAINYVMREGKIDKIVGRNMIESDNPADILREFEMVNQYNCRCKNKFMRYEIGIALQDIDKLKPEDMSEIAQTFAYKMGLHNHQWIACSHKDTGKPHIHLIANRIGVDGKVFDTTFMSNRSARIAEEISREMGLTIANDVHKEKQQQHKKTYLDPKRQEVKEELQRIAYSELHRNTTLDGFLYGLESKEIGVEPVKNKEDKIYGIRFNYKGYIFKASKIGREFGYHSIAKNFSPSLEQDQMQRQSQRDYYQSAFSTSRGVDLLLADVFASSGRNKDEDYDNELSIRKKKVKKKYYGPGL